MRLREKSRTFGREDISQKKTSQTIKTEEIDEALSIIGGINRVVRRPLRAYEVFLRKSSPPPTARPDVSSASVNGTSVKQGGISLQDLRTVNGITFSSLNYASTLPPEIRSRGNDAHAHSFAATLHESGTAPQMVGGDVLPNFPIASDGHAPYQSSQNLLPSHNLNSTPSTNSINDMSRQEHGLPARPLPPDTHSASAEGAWDTGTSSWAQTLDWSNLNIPTNFDFDIGPPNDIPVEAGDDMVQDAWNFVLQELHHPKYSDNGGYGFESQLHI